MLEFYPQIRSVHIAAVSLSFAWFAIRAVALAFGMNWPRHLLARIPGWTIDGTLLTAATMLLTILPTEAFANHWLTVKLAFVLTYLLAGWTSLQPGWTRRRAGLLALLATFAWFTAYGIARAHNPLGWLA